MRLAWTATGVVACIAGVLPATAYAGSARSVLRCDRYGNCSELIHYSAASGETNHVTVEVAGDTVVIRDLAGLHATGGCAQVDEDTASCARISPYAARFGRFGLQDRDDFLDARDMPGATRLGGGRGDDVLLGPRTSRGDFTAGPGDDRMVGGNTADHFIAGRRRDGSDTIFGGGADPPDLPGDEVSYSARSTGIHADAAGDRDDGAPGERDRIVDVEACTAARATTS
jgi:hypothetical protein